MKEVGSTETSGTSAAAKCETLRRDKKWLAATDCFQAVGKFADAYECCMSAVSEVSFTDPQRRLELLDRAVGLAKSAKDARKQAEALQRAASECEDWSMRLESAAAGSGAEVATRARACHLAAGEAFLKAGAPDDLLNAASEFMKLELYERAIKVASAIVPQDEPVRRLLCWAHDEAGRQVAKGPSRNCGAAVRHWAEAARLAKTVGNMGEYLAPRCAALEVTAELAEISVMGHPSEQFDPVLDKPFMVELTAKLTEPSGRIVNCAVKFKVLKAMGRMTKTSARTDKHGVARSTLIVSGKTGPCEIKLRDTTGATASVTVLVKRTQASMKQYVLVAGVDYESEGVKFKVLAENRMKRIIAANAKAKDELRIYLLDFKSGREELTTVTYSSGKKRTNKAALNAYAPITRAHYDEMSDGAGHTHKVFMDKQRNVMSILHVYQRIRSIGSADPGTLHELSFFSHGWMGGPILVNSYDARSQEVSVSAAGTGRDPDDMDPRIEYDFVPPTMGAAALAAFRDAFHADGFVWIWGCAFPTAVHKLLTTVEKNKAYRRSGLADATVLTLKNLGTEERDFMAAYSPSRFAPPATGDVAVPFGVIKFIICEANKRSYAFAVAKAANTTTYAAPLGTYAEYDQKGTTSPLMNVCSKLTERFHFYRNYMGYTFDPEGRRYAAYAPGMTCTPPAAR